VLLSVQTQDVAELRLQQERAERAEARDGKVSYAVPVAVRKIPDWQLARILKQRSPQLRDKDDGIVVRDFLKTHPGLRERVIVTKHSIE
jgi:hypothetical protein